MKLYVKKLTSLHPTKYKDLTLNDGLERYHIYILNCMKDPFKSKPKTFEEWLKTEI